MLSHRNIISNILQYRVYEGKYLDPIYVVNGVTPALLNPLPFFHIFGLTACVIGSASIGTKHVFIPQFDIKLYLELIQKHKITRSFVVPPIVLAFAKYPLVD